MRWWPWRRAREVNGTRQAKDDADRQLRHAHGRSEQVDETVRQADELARRSERFIAQVERSWHLRGIG